MDLNNSFVIAGDVEEVWEFILKPENLAPCMPGAELVEVIDERNWRGRVKVKFGPVALAFDGTIEVLEQDDHAHRLTLHGAGKDGRGRGAATTDVKVNLEAGTEPGTTEVSVVQDMTVSGQIAQFGRGMIADVTAAMTKQFAARLESALLAQRSAPTEHTSETGAAGSVSSIAGAGSTASGSASSPTAAATARHAAPADNAVSGFRMIWLVMISLLKSLRHLVPGNKGARGSA